MNDIRTLIVIGTRYGATASTSEEIAKVLSEEGFDVKVANAKKEKIKDISQYDLIAVGSGMQMGRWTGEAEDFLKRFQNDLPHKKVAIFVSSMKSVPEREGKLAELEKARKIDLDNKVAEYRLNPVAIGFFGSVLDFNKMNVITRRTFGFVRPQLEKDGFKESPSGVYDLRDGKKFGIG